MAAASWLRCRTVRSARHGTDQRPRHTAATEAAAAVMTTTLRAGDHGLHVTGHRGTGHPATGAGAAPALVPATGSTPGLVPAITVAQSHRSTRVHEARVQETTRSPACRVTSDPPAFPQSSEGPARHQVLVMFKSAVGPFICSYLAVTYRKFFLLFYLYFSCVSENCGTCLL